MGLALGVDVGGTKIAAGVVDDDGKIIADLRRPTPATSAEDTERAIVEMIDELRAAYVVERVGVGAAGWVDSARATVYYAPHLPWRDERLADDLADACGLPVVIENDGNAAAWAEARFGAAQGFADAICVTVGTGIGSGLVLGGRIYRGGFGIAGEAGHLRVVPHGRACRCGNTGCWEEYASGRALVRVAREGAERDPQAAQGLLELGDGTPDGILGRHVTAAAEDGDPVARAAFAEVGRWLGQGLADLVAVLDPACIVIGGGVSEAGELLLDPAQEAYEGAVTGRGRRPYGELRLAELGNAAGLVGAADLARAPR